MCREIKFRAWYENVMRGEKVGDDIIWSKTSYYDYDPIIDNKGLCSVESGWDIQGHEDKNDYILEQYTGLKDKNGKEIYEGDIVGIYQEYSDKDCSRTWEELEPWGQVTYEDSRARFGILGDSPYEGEDRHFFDLVEGLEVIGNIHENPELLGGGK